MRDTWSLATPRAAALRARMCAALGADDRAMWRTDWLLGAVAHLVLVLDRPAALVTEGRAEITRRLPVTLAELAEDRDALLAALDQLVGPLQPGQRRAWMLATDLFAEIVGDLVIDHFAVEAGARE